MYLEKVEGPKDLKKLTIKELTNLSSEVRETLIRKLSEAGGHIGPNLGIVEVTVALHYVFDSPKDKIVFDVSHQCYPHKILTGRKKAFIDKSCYHDVTGYTNPKESEHDMFIVGHTSTGISLALGLSKGRDLTNGKENIISIIGDGSLSGGEALEALDYAGEYNHNLIILVNDNDQSIAENHGGIYKNLKDLRESNGTCQLNMFKSFGLDYRYLDDGHDIGKLVELFESVKGIDHPIVLHIHTIKGKGLPYAEKDRERWHAGGPFNIADGSPKYKEEQQEDVLAESLFNLLGNNKKAVVLNAATPMALGFVGDIRKKYVEMEQFVDVGIAEENAMAMISGIAKNGGTPVFGTYAPFLQRTYDQMSHDLCLNNNPATVIVLAAGAYGMNSNTHIALCDIQMFAHIPNLVYLAPTSKEEYLAMFKYSTTQKEHPIAIRIPSQMNSTGIKDNTDYSILNKAKVVRKGSLVAIIGVSNMLNMSIKVADALKAEGKEITVINPLFLTGIDEDLLTSLKDNHRLVITLEDGDVDGGYGSLVATFYGTDKMNVINLGIKKGFPTDYNVDELLAENGMSVEKITDTIKKYL